MSHRGRWPVWARENGRREGFLKGTTFRLMRAIMAEINLDQQYDLSAMREADFGEEVNTVAGYHATFKRMRKARLIP